jgi:hypothetical protein
MAAKHASQADDEMAWLIPERCRMRVSDTTSSDTFAGVMHEAAEPARRYENSWPCGP